MNVGCLQSQLLLRVRCTAEADERDDGNRSRETVNARFCSHEFLPPLRRDDAADVMSQNARVLDYQHTLCTKAPWKRLQQRSPRIANSARGLSDSETHHRPRLWKAPMGFAIAQPILRSCQAPAPGGPALLTLRIREIDHMQKILITGAAGDVGSRLTALL